MIIRFFETFLSSQRGVEGLSLGAHKNKISAESVSFQYKNIFKN
jgi:hypothetical protein